MSLRPLILLLLGLGVARAEPPPVPRVDVEANIRKMLEEGRARGENLADPGSAPPSVPIQPVPPVPPTAARPVPAAPAAVAPAAAPVAATSKPADPPTAPDSPQARAQRIVAPARPVTLPAEAPDERLPMSSRTVIIRGADGLGELRSEVEEARRRNGGR